LKVVFSNFQKVCRFSAFPLNIVFNAAPESLVGDMLLVVAVQCNKYFPDSIFVPPKKTSQVQTRTITASSKRSHLISAAIFFACSEAPGTARLPFGLSWKSLWESQNYKPLDSFDIIIAREFIPVDQ
jgi:hypothetical protein